MGSIPVWPDSSVLDLARIREMLSFFPAAVAYVAGPDLVIDFASDEFRLAGDQEVAGRPAHEVFPALADPASNEVLGQVMHSGQPVRGHEVGRSCRLGGPSAHAPQIIARHHYPAARGVRAGHAADGG